MWEPVGDGQFYMHMFDISQPDLNWDNKEVQDEFLDILKFWGDRGVSGFRVDVASAMSKDLSEPFVSWDEYQRLHRELMKNGKTTLDTHPCFDREANFPIYKEWRKVFNQYNPPLT
jgi:alpha-glucosidase